MLCCSCEQIVEEFKTVNQFKKEVNKHVPDKSLGVIHKGKNGHLSIMVPDEFDHLKDDLEKHTIVVVLRKTDMDEFTEEALKELTSNVIETTKLVFGSQIKQGQIIFSNKKGLSGFRMSSSNRIEFLVE